MVAFVLKIIKGTFFVEGIGSIFFAVSFIPEFGFGKGIFYAVFHSVSAFCNAGVDILGDSSFIRYVSNPVMNVTTMLLIVVSGIGFTVWYDVIENAKRKTHFWKRLTIHSKLAITMTVILIVTGTLFVFGLEYHNPETLGNLSLGEKIMASAFHSVSTRTAGFATVSQTGLRSSTKFLTCMLMFIGGSPGGTAGGVKTTTVAMLFLTCMSVIHGRKDTECFGRKIPAENFRTGFSVIVMAFLFLIAGTTLLTVFEPGKDFLALLYEAVSAIGTVGLTADVTPNLSMAGKIVIMILMYVGRIG